MPAITQDDFDRILLRILSNLTGGDLIRIPGVYELLAEEFNNQVIDEWNEEQEMQKHD